MAKLVAPFIPFVAEAMYQNLASSADDGRESVHLESYPEADESVIDQRLSEATRLAMRVSSLGRAARSKAGIKVRQPLERALVGLRSPDEAKLLKQVEDQVREELNVKSILPLADEREVMELTVQPNTSLLGPKYGEELKKIASALSTADPWEIKGRVDVGQAVEVDGYILEADEVVVTTADLGGYSTSGDGFNTVAVGTHVSEALRLEGLARELVHRIQNMRRSAGFDIADYIITTYQGAAEVDEVVAAQREHIEQETLSREVTNGTAAADAYVETHKVDGLEVVLGIKRE